MQPAQRSSCSAYKSGEARTLQSRPTALLCVPATKTSLHLTEIATSIGKPAAHNSAVLLCRLRGISRADQIVLPPQIEPHSCASRQQKPALHQPTRRQASEKPAAHNTAVLLCRLRCIMLLTRLCFLPKTRSTQSTRGRLSCRREAGAAELLLCI